MDQIKKSWPFILGLVLSISLLWPLFAAPLFTRHDDVEIIRLYEMNKCFLDKQIPCRWVPDLGNLYGYPLFNYYAPLPYYFGEIIYSISHSLIISVKVMYIVAFLGSFVSMYLLARKFWGNLGGALSATFYSFAPYHALDFYVRGEMEEMWALMFFPLIFWAIARLKEKPSLLNLVILALSLAGLITSHNISALIFLPFCLIFGLLLFFQNKDKKFIYFGFLSAVLGIFLSAFYLFPVIVEKNLVHVETTVEGYFSYTEHFEGLKRLFLDRSWGYGASVREVPGGEKDTLSYQIGWVHILGAILALFTAYKLRKKQKLTMAVIIFSFLSLSFVIFMIHPRSQFIWDAIEPLKYLQFPWRFLLLVIFFISFMCGATFKRTNNKILWMGLILLVVALNFSYFKPEKFIQITDKQLLSGKSWEQQVKRSIYDFLPIFAKEPPADLATTRYSILTGDTKIFNFMQGSDWFKFNTDTKTHTIIRLSQYYFPDWKIFVDGQESKIYYLDNSLGLMTIIIGKGNHNIEGRLYDTPVRSISNLISLFAIIATSILLIMQFSRVKKWVQYYRKGIN